MYESNTGIKFISSLVYDMTVMCKMTSKIRIYQVLLAGAQINAS